MRPGRLFFDNGHLLWLVIAITTIAGISALSSLPRLEDPRITHRNPLILAPFPGASAERVEALVTEKIETALKEIPELKNSALYSTSRTGLALIAMELEDRIGPDQNRAIFSRIRDKVSDIEDQLPDGALPPEFVEERRPIAWTLVVAIVSQQDTPDYTIMSRLSEELADRLRAIPGTELVERFGAPEEEVTAIVNRHDLGALGLTAADIAVRAAAADPKEAVGLLRTEQSNLLLEVEGELSDLERIREVIIATDSDGLAIRLGDIAEVSQGWRLPQSSISRVDGQPAVLVAARMGTGVRIDSWATQAKEVVAEFGQETGRYPLRTVFDQSVYTNERLASLGSNLLLGAILVALVVLFTMGWRAALFVAGAMPLVAAITLFLILLSGGALHQMSIFGMIIALGLLVDNAIVTVDEVRKRLSRGDERGEAVARAVRHLFAPLLASSVTTMLAFMPILLLPGNAGDFVGSIGGSVILAIGSSFVLSMTVIAALAGRYLPRNGEKIGWMDRGFYNQDLDTDTRSLLARLLQPPWKAVAVAMTLPAIGFGLSQTLGNEFFPPTDRDMFQAQLWLPTESSIEHTEAVSRQAEQVLRAHPNVEHVYWMVGGNFPRVYYNLIRNQDRAAHYAQAIIKADDSKQVDAMVNELQTELADALPEARVVVQEFGQGPPVEAPVQFRVYGPHIPTLQRLGDEIRIALEEHPDVLNSSATMDRGEPKLVVRAAEEETTLAGLDFASLGAQLGAEYEGAVGGSLLEGLEELPLRVRIASEVRSDPELLSAAELVGPGGQTVNLRALGPVELRPELGLVTRYGGQRANIIKAYIRPGALAINVTEDIETMLGDRGFSLPVGYHLARGGSAEEESEAVGNLATFAPLLVTIMVALLILTFRSLPLAMLLLAVAGLSVGTGLLATWFLQFPISFNTILGCFGLIGIALNDSIVVLAALRAHPEARTGDLDAIVEVTMSTVRHVLSTTFTTIAGFLPLLLLVGGDFWPSLAIVLAGGVLGSSLLALLFVPAVFRWLALRRKLIPEPLPA